MTGYRGGDGIVVEIRDDLSRDLELLGPVREAALAAAQAIAAEARGMAPVGTEAEYDAHPGAYRAGITVQATRTGARVVATARHSHFIDFGVPTRGIPAKHILRRAAAALGFKFKSRS